MERLVDLRGRLEHWTQWIALVGLVGLLVVAVATMGDVLMRWLFNAPIDGLDDVTQLLVAIVVATCFPAGLIHGHNITIRFLGKGLGGRAEHWLESFGAVLTLLFFAAIAWQLLLLTIDLNTFGDTTTTVEIPTAPWWAVATAIIALCVPVQALVCLSRLSQALGGRPVAGPGGEPPQFLKPDPSDDGSSEGGV